MPMARYFLFVGGALLALLFVADAYLTKLPVADRAGGGFDRTTIRIHSDRKWPERVVFDTSHPTIVAASAAVAQASAPAPVPAADVSASARTLDAFAQLQPPEQKPAQLSDPKKLEQKVPPKRRIAKRRPAPPVMLVAQQPQFSLFGNSTW